ncbi:MAG: hypothetical protein JW850_06190, partial [Thermoflexales bacterium]|nr:hypothetical protein [Thermoflexales bacterium]
MSKKRRVQDTQHAFLVAWGWFADHIGLIQALESVQMHQKKRTHTPQAKVIEFLVATLAGLEHLQDISLAAHPLDKDQAVAEAWGQAGWADYSGVSRTLSGLSWDESRAVAKVLDQISRPLIQAELDVLRDRSQRLRFDGDLTGLPVSSSSRSYPKAAFGHMDDEIRLGYQAAVVSLASPTYGRLWLSIAHHPGDTVPSTQAEALVIAAETRTGLRPRRRTDLLSQRIEAFEKQMETTRQRLLSQQTAVHREHARLAEARQHVQERQAVLAELQESYRPRQGKEHPNNRLALARKCLDAAERRHQSCEKALPSAEQRLAKTQVQWDELQGALKCLKKRLARFEQDNAANPSPVEAEFRLDAGFGTYENVALLIEMGYEVYTKAHSHKLVASLKDEIDSKASWTRVGANAEMVAWVNKTLTRCPYPLDVGLERFYTGPTLKHSALLHFGDDPVTENPPTWFKHYNARQTIEAGIKEGKGVFYLHRIKVRSEPAIYLQECFVAFAANFIRWATHWLASQTEATANSVAVCQVLCKFVSQPTWCPSECFEIANSLSS